MRPWGKYDSLVPHDLRNFPCLLKTITTARLRPLKGINIAVGVSTHINHHAPRATWNLGPVWYQLVSSSILSSPGQGTKHQRAHDDWYDNSECRNFYAVIQRQSHVLPRLSGRLNSPYNRSHKCQRAKVGDCSRADADGL